MTNGPSAGTGGSHDRGTHGPRARLAATAEEIAAAAALGARLVTALDDGFPAALARCADAPPVLAVRGRLPVGPAVAVVGSRLGDVYGCHAAEMFARYLAAAGVAVISGLARGIDAAAHAGALAAAGGSTIAVLGCGMGVDYPRGHAALAAAIADRGAVTSQFPCDAPPRAWHFPVRNRVIAALAQAVLVVQALPTSGALTTARLAREMGVPVFALPGPVFEPLSSGPHALLKDGAQLAGHPADILDALDALPRPAPSRATLPQTALPQTALAPDAPRPDSREAVPVAGEAASAGAVLGQLARRAPRSAAQVAARAGLAPREALAALLALEVAGLVERLPGMTYRLAAAPRERSRAVAARHR